MAQIRFGLVFLLCFLASTCGTEARMIESRESHSNNSLDIIGACRSGKLSNPTGEDWKNFEIDQFFQSWSEKVYTVASRQADHETVGLAMRNYFGRPSGLECNANGPCTGHLDDCKDWLGSSDHGEEIPRAYIWYQAYETLADTLYLLIEATDQSAVRMLAVAPAIVSEFVPQAVPDNFVLKAISPVSPTLGALSGILGVMQIGMGAATAGVASGIFGMFATLMAFHQMPSEADQFARLGELDKLLMNLFDTINLSARRAYSDLILYDNATNLHGMQTGMGLHGILKDGIFLRSGRDGPSPLQLLGSGEAGDTIRGATTKLFEWAAINAVWKAQDVFIAYIPYNRKVRWGHDTDDEKSYFNPFQPNHCELLVRIYELRHAMCSGDGMAVLVGEAEYNEINKGPKGVDSDFTIGGRPFDWRDVVRSSVAGWQQQGWDAHVSSPLYEAMEGSRRDRLRSLSRKGDDGNNMDLMGEVHRFNTELDASTAGMFNVPVCQLFDIFETALSRPDSFAQRLTRWNGWCACLQDSASLPAGLRPDDDDDDDQLHSTFFRDHVSDNLKKKLKQHRRHCRVYHGD